MKTKVATFIFLTLLCFGLPWIYKKIIKISVESILVTANSFEGKYAKYMIVDVCAIAIILHASCACYHVSLKLRN